MEGAVCPSSELIILPLEYQYKNCSTKIAAIKNIGAGGGNFCPLPGLQRKESDILH